MKIIITLSIIFSLILLNSSCIRNENYNSYVKLEIVSYDWNLSYRTAISGHSMIFNNELGELHKRSIKMVDTKFLSSISETINKDMVECISLCQIDIRMSILLFKSNDDAKPDTLSFGNIFKAKFNDDYYMLNKELVKTILAEVDNEQLKLFEDYYRDYPND